MVVASLLLLHVSVQQKKDVHLVGMPIEKLMQELSKQFGQTLIASPRLADKTLLIEASQVSLDEVKGQLAKVLNSTWEKRDDGWHLVKTDKQFKQDDDRFAQMRIGFLRKTLDLRKKSLEGNETLTKEMATQTMRQMSNEEKNRKSNMAAPGPSAAGYCVPNQRFFSRFLAKFGLERIAAIKPGERVVFATVPNKVQQPLGFDIREEFERYQQEQKIWLKIAEERNNDPESGLKDLEIRSFQDNQFGLATSFGSISADCENLLFSVFCRDDGSYHMQIVGVPKPGAPDFIYFVGGTSLEGLFANMTESDFMPKEYPEFKLSPDASDFKEFFWSFHEKLSPDRFKFLTAKFADPTKTEPLAYGISESLIFDIKRRKKNLIAIMSDQNLNVFEPVFGDFLFDETKKQINEGFIGFDGTWVQFLDSPGREPNAPRLELKRIIAEVRRTGKFGLIERAQLAAIRPRTNAVSYIERFVNCFATVSSNEHYDGDALKIIGLLSSTEQAAAFSPQGVRFGDLNSKLRQHLFECCFYNSYNRLWQADYTKAISGVIRNEPTLMAPDGIPANAIFKVAESTEEQLKDLDEPGRQNLMATPKQWGLTKYQIDHPEDFPANYSFQFDRKRKLHRMSVRKYEMTLRPNSVCNWQGTLQSVEDAGKETFTIDTIPDDLKAEFEAGYKEAATAAANRRKRNGGGT